ncbi:unnamed protein product [Lathyrus sativus]|nr:unnamed protein product [Lathyrus sativus]
MVRVLLFEQTWQLKTFDEITTFPRELSVNQRQRFQRRKFSAYGYWLKRSGLVEAGFGDDESVGDIITEAGK